MTNKGRPDVSVCIITYNQERFIRQALDSVLAQAFEGDLEVVICDDASTDGTRNCIKEVVGSHPEITWKIKFNSSNIGIAKNFAQAILMCEGRYVSILEGDDYWCDPEKLNKQVTAMDHDGELSICYTNCIDKSEVDGSEKVSGPEHPQRVDITYILKHGWFMRTPTLVFRRDLINNFPFWYYDTYSTDYVLQLLLSAEGPVFRLDDVTAVYRRHPSGVSNMSVEQRIKSYSEKIALLDIINDHFDGEYQQAIRFQQRENYKALVNYSLRSGNWNASILKHFTLYRQNGVIGMAWDRIVKRMSP